MQWFLAAMDEFEAEVAPPLFFSRLLRLNSIFFLDADH
jgi:hypothetical protein